MKLLLPQQTIKRLRRKLRGRLREMGGIMVGEHTGPDEFRVVDISYQKRGGTIAHFIRDPAHHKAFLAEFYKHTGNAYERFNYIGEWHSHPAFEPLPSGEDFRTMYDLVEDPEVGVNFAVLIIARLRGWSTIELSATLFRPGYLPDAVDVMVERDNNTLVNPGVLSKLLDRLW
jgi:integrative and conjugative element protein (TIGR02256 family)